MKRSTSNEGQEPKKVQQIKTESCKEEPKSEEEPKKVQHTKTELCKEEPKSEEEPKTESCKEEPKTESFTEESKEVQTTDESEKPKEMESQKKSPSPAPKTLNFYCYVDKDNASYKSLPVELFPSKEIEEIASYLEKNNDDKYEVPDVHRIKLSLSTKVDHPGDLKGIKKWLPIYNKFDWIEVELAQKKPNGGLPFITVNPKLTDIMRGSVYSEHALPSAYHYVTHIEKLSPSKEKNLKRFLTDHVGCQDFKS